MRQHRLIRVSRTDDSLYGEGRWAGTSKAVCSPILRFTCPSLPARYSFRMAITSAYNSALCSTCSRHLSGTPRASPLLFTFFFQ